MTIETEPPKQERNLLITLTETEARFLMHLLGERSISDWEKSGCPEKQAYEMEKLHDLLTEELS